MYHEERLPVGRDLGDVGQLVLDRAVHEQLRPHPGEGRVVGPDPGRSAVPDGHVRRRQPRRCRRARRVGLLLVGGGGLFLGHFRTGPRIHFASLVTVSGDRLAGGLARRRRRHQVVPPEVGWVQPRRRQGAAEVGVGLQAEVVVDSSSRVVVVPVSTTAVAVEVRRHRRRCHHVARPHNRRGNRPEAAARGRHHGDHSCR